MIVNYAYWSNNLTETLYIGTAIRIKQVFQTYLFFALKECIALLHFLHHFEEILSKQCPAYPIKVIFKAIMIVLQEHWI